MSIHSERFLKERKEILENKKQIKGSQLRRTVHKKQRFKSIYSLDSSKIKKGGARFISKLFGMIPGIGMAFDAKCIFDAVLDLIKGKPTLLSFAATVLVFTKSHMIFRPDIVLMLWEGRWERA